MVEAIRNPMMVEREEGQPRNEQNEGVRHVYETLIYSYMLRRLGLKPGKTLIESRLILHWARQFDSSIDDRIDEAIGFAVKEASFHSGRNSDSFASSDSASYFSLSFQSSSIESNLLFSSESSTWQPYPLEDVDQIASLSARDMLSQPSTGQRRFSKQLGVKFYSESWAKKRCNYPNLFEQTSRHIWGEESKNEEPSEESKSEIQKQDGDYASQLQPLLSEESSRAQVDLGAGDKQGLNGSFGNSEEENLNFLEAPNLQESNAALMVQAEPVAGQELPQLELPLAAEEAGFQSRKESEECKSDYSEYSFDAEDFEEAARESFPWSHIEENTHHGCSRKLLTQIKAKRS